MKQLSKGFSLVELMVAITLGLLVMGAVISVFVGSRSAYQSTAGVGALADSGRSAVSFIQESTRSAGFMGCAHANTTATGTENLLSAAIASPMTYDFSHGVGGYEATTSAPGNTVTLPATQVAGAGVGSWTPSAEATFPVATSNKQVLGSDILIVRSVVPRAVPAYTSVAFAAGAMSFQALNTSSLQPNQLAVITDCVNWWTFQVGGVAAGTPATVNLGGGNSGPLPVGLQAGAVVAPVTTTIYYIGVGSDGDTALMRLELVNGATGFTAEEIAPDVENMQVLYGVDTTGTQTASSYVTANQVVDFNKVVSVKVAVLSASPPGAAQIPAAAPTYNLLGTLVKAPRDTRLRKVFTVTVGVRNAMT
jgi:type IV pilus assembly protein PilW